MNPIEFAQKAFILALKWQGSITSWYRTPKRNQLVGGVPNSYHLTGLGIDILLDDQKKNLPFEEDAIRLGLQALYEGDHYHLQPK